MKRYLEIWGKRKLDSLEKTPHSKEEIETVEGGDRLYDLFEILQSGYVNANKTYSLFVNDSGLSDNENYTEIKKDGNGVQKIYVMSKSHLLERMKLDQTLPVEKNLEHLKKISFLERYNLPYCILLESVKDFLYEWFLDIDYEKIIALLESEIIKGVMELLGTENVFLTKEEIVNGIYTGKICVKVIVDNLDVLAKCLLDCLFDITEKTTSKKDFDRFNIELLDEEMIVLSACVTKSIHFFCDLG